MLDLMFLGSRAPGADPKTAATGMAPKQMAPNPQSNRAIRSGPPRARVRLPARWHRAVEHAISICQPVVGDHIDHAVSQLLVESVASLALEVTLSVQQALQARKKQVEQAIKTIWPSAGTCTSIQPTVWSLTRSRQTGMKSFANGGTEAV
jgi:hypothetical protein